MKNYALARSAGPVLRDLGPDCVAGRLTRPLHYATHGRRIRGFAGPIFYREMKNA
jgi:hypothetical protein